MRFSHRAQTTLPGVRDELSRLMATGDARIKVAAEQQPARSGMGTTLTLSYLVWPRLYVAHVGDSRCYVQRGGQLLRLTTDHTYAQRFADLGGRKPDQSFGWQDVLWNALGGGLDSELTPEVRRVA